MPQDTFNKTADGLPDMSGKDTATQKAVMEGNAISDTETTITCNYRMVQKTAMDYLFGAKADAFLALDPNNVTLLQAVKAIQGAIRIMRNMAQDFD